MLTNAEIEKIRMGYDGRTILSQHKTPRACEDIRKLCNELLTLREAVAPQMADVDALQDPWVGQPFVDIIGTFRNMRYLTRTAILACEQQKQRADEAEKKAEQLKRENETLKGYFPIAHLQSQIATLASERDEARKELAALRSAPGMEDVDECFQNYNGNYTRNQMCDVPKLESIARRAIASRDEAIASRDEVVGLLKWCSMLCGNAIEAMASDRGDEEGSQEARRIIKIVEGK